VRDLGSRNGTFLNGRQAADEPLHEGDVLHLGGYRFRLVRGPDWLALDTEATVGATGPLTRHFVTNAIGVRHLIAQTAVTVLLQPIVTLPGRQVVAYEALGRGRLPGLPESPVALFEMAGALGPEVQEELSQLFRFKAVDLVRHRRDPPVLFLNTHPVELEREGLLESLKQLRSYAPNVDLVLEIHESALAQADFIAWLRNRMSEINVGLAYDDFGAGQARLLELAEAPPHYLKFDRRFVAGIDRAPTSRQRLVASLVAAARELCVKTIAEGVETADEAAASVVAGFSHAQGYQLGRPAPVDDVG
jgi:EAL domain-containing protein (putative c-di-GMP-specific phosphodiesterase class I)